MPGYWSNALALRTAFNQNACIMVDLHSHSNLIKPNLSNKPAYYIWWIVHSTNVSVFYNSHLHLQIYAQDLKLPSKQDGTLWNASKDGKSKKWVRWNEDEDSNDRILNLVFRFVSHHSSSSLSFVSNLKLEIKSCCCYSAHQAQNLNEKTIDDD